MKTKEELKREVSRLAKRIKVQRVKLWSLVKKEEFEEAEIVMNEIKVWQKQYALQKKMIRSLEFKMKQGKCFVDVMDFQYTNDIVLPTGYPQTQVDPVVLCKLLKVDAVIQSMIDIREPTNELAALFFEEQTGVMLYTNTVSIRSTLHDTIHKEPLWSLNASRVGYLGSLKNVMQSTVIRRTTRNTPYNLKKQPFKKLYLRSQE